MEAYWVVVAAGVVVLYALSSNRLSRTPITGPMLFVAAGLLFGPDALGVVDAGRSPEVIIVLLELTLAVVLFSDATTISASRWRQEAGIPGRLLAFGLPLTIALGFVLAAPLAGLDLWGAALVAAILAPTDASLGAAVLTNPRVPQRLRQGLNVEGGLNDGIVLPVILVVLRLAEEAEAGGSLASTLGFVAKEILAASAVGGVLGFVVARAMLTAKSRGWMSPMWTGVGGLALAFVAYGVAVPLGGSGFIAAWVTGLALSLSSRGELHDVGEFGEALGSLLVMVSYFIFGGVYLGPALGSITWQVALYAVLSLTVVRMLPVGVAMMGSGLERQSVAFLGWFGPRGLASIIFAGVVVEEAGLADTASIIAIVMVTVAFSVFAHGATAWWGSERYADWYEAHRSGGELSAEALEGPAISVPARHRAPFRRDN